MALFNEGLVLQNHISSRPLYSRCDDQHRFGRFAHLMMEGCVNAALRCLAPTCDCGPLSLDHVVGSHADGSSKTVYDVSILLDVLPILLWFWMLASLPVLFIQCFLMVLMLH